MRLYECTEHSKSVHALFVVESAFLWIARRSRGRTILWQLCRLTVGGAGPAQQGGAEQARAAHKASRAVVPRSRRTGRCSCSRSQHKEESYGWLIRPYSAFRSKSLRVFRYDLQNHLKYREVVQLRGGPKCGVCGSPTVLLVGPVHVFRASAVPSQAAPSTPR